MCHKEHQNNFKNGKTIKIPTHYVAQYCKYKTEVLLYNSATTVSLSLAVWHPILPEKSDSKRAIITDVVPQPWTRTQNWRWLHWLLSYPVLLLLPQTGNSAAHTGQSHIQEPLQGVCTRRDSNWTTMANCLKKEVETEKVAIVELTPSGGQ